MWYEEIYEVANIKAVVAFYKNIPIDIRDELDALVVNNYDKNIFNCDLFDASMLLLANGYMPNSDVLSMYHYQRLGQGQHHYYLNNKSAPHLKEEALESLSRKPTDIIVLIFKDDMIIGTMTLMPFKNRKEMTGLQYIHSDCFDAYPDVPVLEFGRLAKGPQKDLLSSAAMATGFLVARNFMTRWFFSKEDLKDVIVCGESFKYVIDGLSMFFPIVTLPTRLNWGVLHHALGMYFLTRDVLGSLKSAGYLIKFLDYVRKWGKGAGKIKGLIERGTGRVIEDFKPEKYKVHLFYFVYNDPRTVQGFLDIDKMIKEMTNEKMS